MKKTDNKTQKQIIFFASKLPPSKQEEALDYIKWLWLSKGEGKEENVKHAVSKMREIQSKHKAYEGWDSVKEIRKWRKSH